MKKVLFLLLASFLVLAACGNEESKSEDKKEAKASDKESKKDEEKESEKEKDKSDDKSNEEVATQDETTEPPVQSQEQVNTQEQQPDQSQEQEIQGGNDVGAVEEQQAFLRDSDPEYYSEVDENYINRDAEFYDSLPQEEQDKLKQHTDNMADADEDDPRWDEQLEINMRDDISDEERRELSDQVWD